MDFSYMFMNRLSRIAEKPCVSFLSDGVSPLFRHEFEASREYAVT